MTDVFVRKGEDTETHRVGHGKMGAEMESRSAKDGRAATRS